MGSTSNLAAMVAFGGFLLAFIFGVVANRTNFCTMGAVSDVVNMGSWDRMRMWLLPSRWRSWARKPCKSRG